MAFNSLFSGILNSSEASIRISREMQGKCKRFATSSATSLPLLHGPWEMVIIAISYLIFLHTLIVATKGCFAVKGDIAIRHFR